MPTKNRRDLLERALNSILEQTYSNLDVIVVDDGSTDDTVAFLETVVNNDQRVRFFSNKTSAGACAARNIAIQHAYGKFITGLDDDDLFLPNRIESLLSQYDGKYAFICSSAWWDYGKKQRLIDSRNMDISLKQQLNYNEATTQVLVATERVKALGGFDETFVACQDYDLWTRLIEHYGMAKRIANPTYIINDTGSSNRMISSPNSVKGYHQFMQKHGHLMSRKNIINQEFMMLRREARVMSLHDLIRQIGTGYFTSKLRYFLSSNFSIIRSLHKKFYKNS
ncbi:glycosyltransferase [Thalassotalea atypica]|uniref:glycosyltransferase n=1 Tax=Thalassotalea atypica TaxID=2054316 RepID=UPI0025725A98|nr:glycosyltransferase [Thalassotalea atypica]